MELPPRLNRAYYLIFLQNRLSDLLDDVRINIRQKLLFYMLVVRLTLGGMYKNSLIILSKTLEEAVLLLGKQDRRT